MAEEAKPEENSATRGLNREEIERIRNLLGSLQKPSEACSLALSGISSFPFCMNASEKFYSNSWIIDSGATDHMTPTSHFFHSYTPCPSSRKIVVANGTLATVAGLGNIHITPTLILKDVLHVPKLSANLISIQKLTHDLKCYAIFSLLIVFFRTRARGGGLDLLRKEADFITLNHPKAMFQGLFSVPQIKMSFGYITYV